MQHPKSIQNIQHTAAVKISVQTRYFLQNKIVQWFPINAPGIKMLSQKSKKLLRSLCWKIHRGVFHKWSQADLILLTPSSLCHAHMYYAICNCVTQSQSPLPWLAWRHLRMLPELQKGWRPLVQTNNNFNKNPKIIVFVAVRLHLLYFCWSQVYPYG